MNTLNTLMLVAHVLIAASIIGLVMLQKGKGADAGAGFGAGASGTVFGARGSANFLSRSTAVAAALFFGTSLTLAYLNRSVDGVPSLLEMTVAEENLAIDPDESLKLLGEDETVFDMAPAPEEEIVIEYAEDDLPAVPGE
jgi:preprotein translocase subunit SecG